MCPYKFVLPLWTDDERIDEEILVNKPTNEELQIRMMAPDQDELEIKRGALTKKSQDIIFQVLISITYTLKSSKIILLFNQTNYIYLCLILKLKSFHFSNSKRMQKTV